ncbi:carbonate dehydratase [Amphibiibacter pelophylacis]|uniref:Carbonate dehydratase n=1 Tax=Amphibiibacter pelophylacis TaxID=1799477 RepID=A0ACC6P5R2_9BURK
MSDDLTQDLDQLLQNNKSWAARCEAQRPGFFTTLTKQQSPQYLWIGCADSRVPANDLVGLLPGELFVHRNIANLVVHSDINAMSVIQFAVDQLAVRHILVVGHSRCSGVRAALENQRIGIADLWLGHLKDVRRSHQDWLSTLPDVDARLDALCELNVLEQSLNLCRTQTVQDAWARGQSVIIHGWVYGLHNGLMDDMSVTVSSADDAKPTYQRALAALKRRHEERHGLPLSA